MPSLKNIKRIFKYLGIALILYALSCLLTPFNKALKTRSTKNQISYLSTILNNGYDDELQLRFPEGKIFSNAILALSIIEYCDRNNIADEYYSNIIDSCIQRMQAKNALRIFDAHLEPKYGMFYNGWINYVYHSYINSILFQNSKIKIDINIQSDIIERRLTNSLADSLESLDTYSGANWPADNFIGILSMKNDSIKKRWMYAILNSTKHPSNLVHHSGSYQSQIRGSSSSMITLCLAKLEYAEIEDYNNKHKEIFIDEFLGVQLVKENEDGSNTMDVDSGPVIFGYGASATIMNIKTQASLNKSQSKFTWALMNLISFPANISRKKYYLFKKEPMLDLFMLWACVEL